VNRAFGLALIDLLELIDVPYTLKACLCAKALSGNAMPLIVRQEKTAGTAQREGFPQLRRFIRLLSGWQLTESP
jgi:hypothetical protein